MQSAAADTFRQAARLNRQDPRRQGNTVSLQGDGVTLVAAGDIHGYRAGLETAIGYAALDRTEGRILVLQEIIHGPLDDAGHDRSVELLLKAAALKVSMGPKVLFIMGNHDLAQITGSEIAKEGRGVCKSFVQGARRCFGGQAAEVLESVKEFQLSMPLAVRCPNKVMMVHSLPSPHRMDLAGLDILDRGYRDEDLVRGGPAYEWTWGRDHTDQQTDGLAQSLGVEFFIIGHRNIPAGWEKVTSRAIAIATDHNGGCVVEFAGADRLTAQTAAEHIRPLAAIMRR